MIAYILRWLTGADAMETDPLDVATLAHGWAIDTGSI